MHALDITNGTASFAIARDHAWHRLGQVMPGEMTADEALTAAHMKGWNVRKVPLLTGTGEGVDLADSGIEVPGQFVTVRTNPVTGKSEPLGVVGSQWTALQNEETVDLLDALVDQGGAFIDTIGALKGGRQTFVSMRLPEAMEIELPDGRKDRTEFHIAALNSHDGSTAFRFIVSPIRIVCANTQAIALNTAVSKWSARHTPGIRSSVDEARRALGLTFKYQAAFEEEMKVLVATQVEEDTARALLASVFEVDKTDNERGKLLRTAHVDGVLSTLALETNDGARGTAYGLLNAATEYVDHFWPTLQDGAMVATGAAHTDNPMSAIAGAGADVKAKVARALHALV